MGSLIEQLHSVLLGSNGREKMYYNDHLVTNIGSHLASSPGHSQLSMFKTRGGATGSKGHKLICISTVSINFGDDFQWG